MNRMSTDSTHQVGRNFPARSTNDISICNEMGEAIESLMTKLESFEQHEILPYKDRLENVLKRINNSKLFRHSNLMVIVAASGFFDSKSFANTFLVFGKISSKSHFDIRSNLREVCREIELGRHATIEGARSLLLLPNLRHINLARCGNIVDDMYELHFNEKTVSVVRPFDWVIQTHGRTGVLNFKDSQGNILFHFNGRSHEKQIVMNTYTKRHGQWGREERIPFMREDMDDSKNSVMNIMVRSDGFVIYPRWENGTPDEIIHNSRYKYRHRMHFHTLYSVEICREWEICKGFLGIW